MLNKNNSSFLYLFSIVLLIIFPTMTIPIGTRVMPIGLIFAIILFLVYINKLIKNIFILKNMLSSKILLAFTVWAMFSAFFSTIFFKISYIKMLFSIFLGCVLAILLPYLLSFNFFKNKNYIWIIKFYTISLYIIMFLGLVDFIIYFFKIPILDILYNSTIINARLFKMGQVISNFNMYKCFLIPRVQAVFEEPSHLAWFINCNLFSILAISSSKWKIFKNKWINFSIKKTLLIMTYVVLLLTQSPINLIFTLIITIIFLFIKCKLSLKKIFYILFGICCVCLLLLQLIYHATSEQTLLYRIRIVIESISDLQNLILYEGSLGTRIVSYALMFKIFLKHIITGCGWGNLGTFLYREIASTHMFLSVEIINRFQESKTNDIGYCVSVFYRTAAETGLVGIILIYAFFLQIIKYLNFIIRNTTGIFQEFNVYLKYSTYAFIILTFYDSQLYIAYFWVLYGTIVAVYYNIRINHINEALKVQNDFY